MKIQEMAIGILVDFIFSFVSFSILQSTITHIFYLGKSKNAAKKLRKEYSILERIRLRHVKDSVKVSTSPVQIKKGATKLPCKTTFFRKADIGILSKLQIGPAFQGSE